MNDFRVILFIVAIFLTPRCGQSQTQAEVRARLSVDICPNRAFLECASLMETFRQRHVPFSKAAKIDPWETVLQSGAIEGERDISTAGVYVFVIVGKDYDSYLIGANSNCGGRSFLYDPRWRIARLQFRTTQERLHLAEWIRRFYAGEVDQKSKVALFAAIPNLGGLAAPNDTMDRAAIAGYLGDFLFVSNMEQFVLSVAFEDFNPTTRELALRSILSVRSGLQKDVKTRLTQLARKRIEQLYTENSPDIPKVETDLLEALSKALRGHT